MSEELEVASALELLRARTAAVTPARIFIGGVDGGYRTADLLGLRADHAAARDAVRVSLDADAPDLAALALPEIQTCADSIEEHLLRPDLGRRLTEAARATLRERGTSATDVQVLVGDGLSSAAVHAQVPRVLPAFLDGCRERGWTVGRPFLVRHARVGVMNEVGAVLEPEIVVLLIGERPGLASADGLSAYLAYRPRPGCTDADRNLLSNIRDRGTPPAEAVARLLAFVGAMRAAGVSGVALKEPDVAGTIEPG